MAYEKKRCHLGWLQSVFTLQVMQDCSVACAPLLCRPCCNPVRISCFVCANTSWVTGAGARQHMLAQYVKCADHKEGWPALMYFCAWTHGSTLMSAGVLRGADLLDAHLLECGLVLWAQHVLHGGRLHPALRRSGAGTRLSLAPDAGRVACLQGCTLHACWPRMHASSLQRRLRTSHSTRCLTAPRDEQVM